MKQILLIFRSQDLTKDFRFVMGRSDACNQFTDKVRKNQKA